MPRFQSRWVPRPDTLVVWLVALVAFGLTAYSLAGPIWFKFDLVNGQGAIGPDDAFRFFLYRSASENPEVLLWDFLPPLSGAMGSSLTAVFGGNILFSRLALATLSASVTACFYSAIRALTGKRVVAGCVITLIILMPLYLTVSVAFLGEAFVAQGVILALYFRYMKYSRAESITVGLLPLLRPEGMFILLAYFLERVLKRDWRLLVVAAVPGTIYFIAGWVNGGTAFFMAPWRIAYRVAFYGLGDEAIRDPLAMVAVLNAFFVASGILGFLGREGRAYLPYISGVVVWILFLSVGAWVSYINAEPRYFMMAIPVLCWGMALLYLSVREFGGDGVRHRILPFFCVFSLLLVAENVRQNDFLRYELGKSRWPIDTPAPANRNLLYIEPSSHASAEKMAPVICEALALNKHIDRLFVYESFFFWHIDPDCIPPSVEVHYLPITTGTSDAFLDGRLYSMHGLSPNYAFYRLTLPTRDVGRFGLYVSNSASPLDFEPSLSMGPFDMYMVGYSDVTDRQNLREMIDEAVRERR